jgi:hypothetical protein
MGAPSGGKESLVRRKDTDHTSRGNQKQAKTDADAPPDADAPSDAFGFGENETARRGHAGGAGPSSRAPFADVTNVEPAQRAEKDASPAKKVRRLRVARRTARVSRKGSFRSIMAPLLKIVAPPTAGPAGRTRGRADADPRALRQRRNPRRAATRPQATTTFAQEETPAQEKTPVASKLVARRPFLDDSAKKKKTSAKKKKKKKTSGVDDDFFGADDGGAAAKRGGSSNSSLDRLKRWLKTEKTAFAAADSTLSSIEMFEKRYKETYGELKHGLLHAERQRLPLKKLVKAKTEAANAACSLWGRLVESGVGGVVGATADAGAALRTEVDNRYYLMLSWARPSDFSSRFKKKKKGKQIKPGEPHPWHGFARKNAKGRPVKCKTYKYADLFIKTFHQSVTRSKKLVDVPVHGMNLHSGFTDYEEETNAGGFLKPPDKWVQRAQAASPWTVGPFLGKTPCGKKDENRFVAEMMKLAGDPAAAAAAAAAAADSDEPAGERDSAGGAAGPDDPAGDYGITFCFGKAGIDIARQNSEDEGFEFEIWPDPLIESLLSDARALADAAAYDDPDGERALADAGIGVDPALTRYDGSSHADGQPSYGIGQITNKDRTRMKLVVCLPAVGDAIDGSLANCNGGAEFCVVSLWANLNVLNLALTDGEFIPLDDLLRNPFIAHTPVTKDDLVTAMEEMKDYEYAKNLYVQRSAGARKGARKRQQTMGPAGLSAAGRKGAKTKGPAGLSAAGRKGAKTKGPAGLSAAARKRQQTMGPAGLSAAVIKGNTTRATAGLSAGARKAQKRRAKANGVRTIGDACYYLLKGVLGKGMSSTELGKAISKRNLATLNVKSVTHAVSCALRKELVNRQRKGGPAALRKKGAERGRRVHVVRARVRRRGGRRRRCWPGRRRRHGRGCGCDGVRVGDG